MIIGSIIHSINVSLKIYIYIYNYFSEHKFIDLHSYCLYYTCNIITYNSELLISIAQAV